MEHKSQEEATNITGQSVPAGIDTVTSAEQTAPTMSSPQKKNSKKKWLFAGLATVLVAVAASVGVYAGVVVPNKPENVWNKAMEQTGKGLSTMGERVGTIFDFKTMKGEGSFTAKVSGVEVKGDSKIESSTNTANVSLNVSALDNDIKLNLISSNEQNSTYPNMYIKVDGLSDISVGGTKISEQVPNISQIDGQWFMVSADEYKELLKSIEQQSGLSSNADTSQLPTLESKDTKAIVDAVLNAAENNLFSKDEAESTIKMNSFIAKENRQGRDAYRYSVSIDPNNAQEFVKALVDGLKSTKLEEILKASGMSLSDIKTSTIADNLKDFEKDTKVEIWVDASTKLVRAIRFIDAKNAAQYIEFSMEYNGDDAYPFVISAMLGDNSADMIDIRLNATVDTKSNKTTLVAKISSADVTVDANFAINYSNDELKIDVPTNTKSLNDLMTLFGIDTNNLGGLLNGQGTNPSTGTLQSCLEITDPTLLQACILNNTPTEYN